MTQVRNVQGTNGLAPPLNDPLYSLLSGTLYINPTKKLLVIVFLLGIPELNVNSVGFDQFSPPVGSDLGLHSLPGVLLWDTWLEIG